MMENEFGKAIKIARTKAGMTQEQLGEKIGYTKQAISNWEMGKSIPRAEDKIALQELLEFEPAPQIERKEQVDKVKSLKEIKTDEELDMAIDRIIKEYGFRSPFEEAVNYMLKKTLWILTGDFVYQNILYRLYMERRGKDLEKYFDTWDTVAQRIDWVLDKSVSKDPDDKIVNKLAASIYYELEGLREDRSKRFKEELMTGKHGKEGSVARELFDEDNPDYNSALWIADKSCMEAEEFIKLFPNSEAETSVITEFRRALIEIPLYRLVQFD